MDYHIRQGVQLPIHVSLANSDHNNPNQSILAAVPRLQSKDKHDTQEGEIGQSIINQPFYWSPVTPFIYIDIQYVLYIYTIYAVSKRVSPARHPT